MDEKYESHGDIESPMDAHIKQELHTTHQTLDEDLATNIQVAGPIPLAAWLIIVSKSLTVRKPRRSSAPYASFQL